MGESSSSSFQHSQHPQVHSWNDYCATNHQFKGYVSTIHHPPKASRIILRQTLHSSGLSWKNSFDAGATGPQMGGEWDQPPSPPHVCWGKNGGKKIDAFLWEVGLRWLSSSWVCRCFFVSCWFGYIFIYVLSFTSYVGFTPVFCYLEVLDVFFFDFFLIKWDFRSNDELCWSFALPDGFPVDFPISNIKDHQRNRDW